MSPPAHRVDRFSRTPAMVIRRLEQAGRCVGFEARPENQTLGNDGVVDGAKDVGGSFHGPTVALPSGAVIKSNHGNLRGTV